MSTEVKLMPIRFRFGCNVQLIKGQFPVTTFKRIFSTLATSITLLLLGGCKLAIMDPKGIIAAAEKHLLIESTLLMLVIVIPVTILTIVIAWKYRASNTKARYKPNWSHSTRIELVCWFFPLVIVVILSIMTWIGTHELDPYKPIHIKGKKTLVIQVVALEWKWLFIYPKQHIASVNFMQIPINTPIELQLTSDAPMNSLEIPRLAGQIYTMAGMRTKLNLVANVAGTYKGLSTNYSGDGFAGMTFKIKAGSDKAFKQWVSAVSQSKKTLNLKQYQQLVKPTEHNKPEFFANVKQGLFHDVIMKFMSPKMNAYMTRKT